jgi:hypothetical protein
VAEFLHYRLTNGLSDIVDLNLDVVSVDRVFQYRLEPPNLIGILLVEKSSSLVMIYLFTIQ